MSFRQVLINEQAYVHYELDSLIIENDKKELKIPINDIAIIVFESNEISISTRLISELSLKNIIILLCDCRHMPVSYLLPFGNHYRIPLVHKLQIEQTDELKDYIWEKLVKGKIKNSRLVMEIENASKDIINMMKVYESEIEGSDESNREGTAAKVFFNYLYGKGFNRREIEDSINKALNYGYGVFRSAITRLLCTYGFTAHIGIHHNSMQNAYNLSYDFIEPYRAIIDYYVYNHLYYFDGNCELQTEVRKELICLLNAKVRYNKREYTVLYSMELLIKSYLSLLEEGVDELAIPEIIKIDFNELFNEL
ncbi:type II CRISPR-associated endonuclease Cas1 [Caviibacter abscessus]|uniref:type II CRISPR-associated endonuclease Cas1 n=1 Tax=Caviibacter abscessus TaxID=1766719 RepID=UPI000839652B|nr:type II CRISPR-associated endonuclease Cas1 [Caviibacter abscessus]